MHKKAESVTVLKKNIKMTIQLCCPVNIFVVVDLLIKLYFVIQK